MWFSTRNIRYSLNSKARSKDFFSFSFRTLRHGHLPPFLLYVYSISGHVIFCQSPIHYPSLYFGVWICCSQSKISFIHQDLDRTSLPHSVDSIALTIYRGSSSALNCRSTKPFDIHVASEFSAIWYSKTQHSLVISFSCCTCIIASSSHNPCPLIQFSL